MNSSTPMTNEFMVPDCKLLFIGVNRPFNIPGIRQSTQNLLTMLEAAYYLPNGVLNVIIWPADCQTSMKLK